MTALRCGVGVGFGIERTILSGFPPMRARTTWLGRGVRLTQRFRGTVRRTGAVEGFAGFTRTIRRAGETRTCCRGDCDADSVALADSD